MALQRGHQPHSLRAAQAPGAETGKTDVFKHYDLAIVAASLAPQGPFAPRNGAEQSCRG